MDFIEIVAIQSGGLWGLVLNPIAGFTLFLCILMITSKYPYEVTEAETELVIGPATEYSGIMFGLSMGYGYVKLYVLSFLFSHLFLGGWYPLIWPFTLHSILPGIIVLIKSFIIMFIAVFMRSIYPRFRLDQLIKIGWRELLILSIISLFLSIFLAIQGVVK
jgi:NADH-quinone oxidoreductase subunit H